MATPIGHGLAALSLFWASGRIGQRTFPFLWLAVIFALMPDLDFLPGMIIGKPAAFHHGVSHSAGFALVAALIGTVLARRGTGRLSGALFLLLFFSYSSHLVLDYFGSDSRPPYGIPLFWPLSSERYLSPVPLFHGVHHVRSTDGRLAEWVQGVLSWQNVEAIALEVLLLLPFLMAARWWQLSRNVKEPVRQLGPVGDQ
ncbi:MAG TPA: metal-dependent hydrolase [Acidobacteriota bacterium]|nr:metal-dependent hydrolase [Acidobacteriota bacterium]